MSEAVNLSEPIEIVDIFGTVSSAKYLYPLNNFSEHHVIWCEGEEFTVDAQNRVVGRFGKEGGFDENYYQLRNRKV